ncbi:hypothetical protein [Arthrobacter sp. C152]
MSFSPFRRPLPRPRQLQCGTCGTGHHLTIHAVTAIGRAGGDLVSVSYTCNACHLFQEHVAYASDVAAALHQIHWMPNVMVFGDDYIHCGFPMEDAGFEVEKLCYRISNGGSNAVFLPTRVLRCHCGFQLEVPQ